MEAQEVRAAFLLKSAKWERLLYMLWSMPVVVMETVVYTH